MSNFLIRSDYSHAFTPTQALDDKVQARVAKKAGFKAKGNDSFVKRSFTQKRSDFFAATRSNSVVAKATREANHYVGAAMLREMADLENSKGVSLPEAVINSQGVKRRVYREDFLRFHGAWFEKKQNPKTQNGWAYWFSRKAHLAHGVTEICAAPTGFAQKMMQGVMAPNAHDKSNTSKLHMAAFLLPIGMIFTAFFTKCKDGFQKVAGHGTLGAGVPLAFFIAYPVASALVAAVGLFFTGCSKYSTKKADLGTKAQNDLIKKHNVLMTKLAHFVASVADRKMGYEMTVKALNKKINAEFRNDDNKPELLEKLIGALKPEQTHEQRLEALSRAAGEYLQVEGTTSDELEKASTFERFKLKRQLRDKEAHFVALCSLVDHPDVQSDMSGKQIDLRRKWEKNAKEDIPKFMLKSLSVLSNALVYKPAVRGAQAKIDKWIHDIDPKNVSAKYADPANAYKNRFNGQSILENPHQYGRFTVGLARASETLRRVTLDIVLARNAQMSRIFYNGCMWLSTALSRNPANRTVNFHFGRLFGGLALSAAWGIALVATFGAAGVAYSGLSHVLSADFKISYIATGTMMAAVMAPAALLMLASQLAARLEGWKGTIQKPEPKASANAFRWNSPAIARAS